MNRVEITFDARVFRLDAVKKAGYRFADRCSVAIDSPCDGKIRVVLTMKSATTSCGAVEGDFRNEVLDQELRESVALETVRVRDLLLAQAFSGISVIDSVGETADYRTDPLGIARSQVE